MKYPVGRVGRGIRLLLTSMIVAAAGCTGGEARPEDMRITVSTPEPSTTRLALQSSGKSALPAPVAGEAADIKDETQKLVTQGLEFAAKNDWDNASAYLNEASRISENIFVHHLSAVAATHLGDALEAFRYAKAASFAGSSSYPEIATQLKEILEWSRPAAIGSDDDCPYRPRQAGAPCPIERPGTLEMLVKKYFHEDYVQFWLDHVRAEAEAEIQCPFLAVHDKTGDVPPDTKNRCEARRVFSFYKFPPPPDIKLPPPGYQVPW